MNMDMLPIALFDVICEYAYNCPCEKDMFLDIEYQWMVQKNIPALFFTPCVPTLPLFQRERYISLYVARRNHSHYVELFTYNPFRKGNPYFPTNAIHQHAKMWSSVPLDMCSLLRNNVVRKARKYKGSLAKNLRQFLNTNQCWLESWNQALLTIFSHDFWYDVHSYTPYSPLEDQLIKDWVADLRGARFGSV